MLRDSIEKAYNTHSPNLMQFAQQIASPALIYDVDQLVLIASVLARELSAFEIHFAVKASYNPTILKYLARMLDGCDVSGQYEYELAKSAGFKKITSTSPYYSADDMIFFSDSGIILDLNSVEQIELFKKTVSTNDIGLRIKIPIKDTYETTGAGSRFGLCINDDEFHRILSSSNLVVKRLHAHTGQLNKAKAIYVFRYLLALSEYFCSVETIILGGGITHIFRNSSPRIEREFNDLVHIINQWRSINNRPLQVILEPGDALVSPCGYLVSTVISVFINTNNEQCIIVDSSAWNIAPWGTPIVKFVGAEKNERVPTIIYGCSCYEEDCYIKHDKITNRKELFYLPHLKAGDRVIMAPFGGYTMTNIRHFNGIAAPKEYYIINNLILDNSH